ncbi:hypothetical protein TorRG33x02_120810 [Trema orientale]|uniref:Uncharacterized protein n=1 Tax=Trema orientale TaxID=63057 RepID=A0A2P5F2N1_TREOI|nr:hypothetical protein TorRG33x02_120810 [Trema orientale]
MRLAPNDRLAFVYRPSLLGCLSFFGFNVVCKPSRDQETESAPGSHDGAAALLIHGRHIINRQWAP